MNNNNSITDILKSERIIFTYEAALRFLLLLAGAFGVPQFLFWLIRFHTFSQLIIREHYDFVELGIPLLMFVSLFWILVNVLTYHNVALYKSYRRWEETNPASSAFLFLISRPVFWINALLFSVIYFALPTRLICAALWEIAKNHNLTEYESAIKLMLLAVLSVLGITSSLTAISTWQDKKAPKHFAFIGKTVFWNFLFTLLGIVLYIYIQVCSPLYPTLKAIFRSKIFIAVLVILILIPIASFTRALIKRKIFLKELDKVCRSISKQHTKIKKPYLSVFFPSLSEPFELTVGDNRFSCKVISGRRTYTRLRIDPDGVCRYIIPVKFPYVNAVLFQIKLPIRYSFESEHPKLIVFNPSPHYIYVESDKKQRQLDNGSEVGGYRIYNSTAFLNAIERDCLGK